MRIVFGPRDCHKQLAEFGTKSPRVYIHNYSRTWGRNVDDWRLTRLVPCDPCANKSFCKRKYKLRDNCTYGKITVYDFHKLATILQNEGAQFLSAYCRGASSLEEQTKSSADHWAWRPQARMFSFALENQMRRDQAATNYQLVQTSQFLSLGHRNPWVSYLQMWPQETGNSWRKIC